MGLALPGGSGTVFVGGVVVDCEAGFGLATDGVGGVVPGCGAGGVATGVGIGVSSVGVAVAVGRSLDGDTESAVGSGVGE